LYYLARSANLLEGPYIFCHFVFFIFHFFNGRHSRPGISKSNGLIFTKISGLVDRWTGLLTCMVYHFAIHQGALPWQPIKVAKSAFFMVQSSLSRCHSKMYCNIAILMSKD